MLDLARCMTVSDRWTKILFLLPRGLTMTPFVFYLCCRNLLVCYLLYRVDSNSKLGCMCALGAQLRGRPWPIASYTQIKNVKMVGDVIHQTPYEVGGKKQDTSALNALLVHRHAARIGILSKER